MKYLFIAVFFLAGCEDKGEGDKNNKIPSGKVVEWDGESWNRARWK